MKIVAARAEAGRAREHQRRAQQVIADAQAAWADGRQQAAIEVLTNFAPPHDLIAQALQDFRGRIAQADEAKRRAAAEQAEVAAQARRDSDAKLSQVEAAIAAREYGPAQQLVDAGSRAGSDESCAVGVAISYRRRDGCRRGRRACEAGPGGRGRTARGRAPRGRSEGRGGARDS